MADEKDETAAAQETSTPPLAAPHPWLPLLFTLATALVLASLAAALSASYWKARPLDLRGYSWDLLDRIELILRENRIPPDHIAAAPRLPQQDAQALWYSGEFTIRAPQYVSAAGLEDLLARRMAASGALVERGAPGSGQLTLQLAGRELARLHFETPPQITETTLDCGRLAGEMAAVLQIFASAESAVERSTRPAKSVDGRAWTQTHFTLETPPGVLATAVKQAIEERLSGWNAPVLVRRGPELGETILAVSNGGVECVEILLRTAAPSQPPAPQTPVPEVAKEQSPLELEPSTLDEAFAPRGPRIIRKGQETLKEHTPPQPDAPPTPAPPEAEELAKLTTPKPKPPELARAMGYHVAIIVDDGGYGGPATDAILALDTRLTLAILPFEPHSADTARRAAELGFETLLHLPMEKMDGVNPHPEAILAEMTEDEVRALTEKALASTPGVAGINNHEGSKFTTDERAMRRFLKVIQNMGLFFVDSRTVSSSVAYETALEMGVPAARNRLFLDNPPRTRKGITAQFERLIGMAKDYGSAIGICHFDETTAAALAELLPRLDQEGIELVHVSELTR